MTVLIPHPTEELKLITFQKELLKELFEGDRIIYCHLPLWINLNDFNIAEKEKIQKVEFGNIEISEKEIFYPVKIQYSDEEIISKLTLVCLHSGCFFSEKDKIIILQKKQPVKLLKIFRLGIEQTEGPYAKSISKSVWCKLK